jgi:uncharacterized RDD family membrane protein YckC
MESEMHSTNSPSNMIVSGLRKSVTLALCALFALSPALAQNAPGTAEDATPNTAAPIVENPEKATNASAASDEMADEDDSQQGRGPKMVDRGAVVVVGRDVLIKTNEVAETVVVLFGSAKIEGRVRDVVVTIGGDGVVNGKANQAVSILGSLKVGPNGKVRDQTVAVAGDVDVQGAAGHQVVAVLGDVKAGNKTHLREVVSVGGRVETEDGVTIDHQPAEVDLGGITKSLRSWLWQCVLKLRPLAPQVGWVWIIAAFFFFLYLLIALIMPGLVRACVGELTRRPTMSFFMGLLAKILLPLIAIILAATGIGAVVVPFVFVALIFGAWVGKVALFESLGMGLGRRFGAAVLERPLVGFLAGIFIITLLYMVPIIGLLTLIIISLWGLGGAVLAAFGGLRREAPVVPVTVAPGASAFAVAGNPGFGTTPGDFGTGATQSSAATGTMTAEATLPNAPATALPEAYSYPRATFWERMGAAFLDLVLIGIVSIVVHIPPFAFVVALAYFAGLWTWKGTSIGGIVLGLKVVRQDGQPLTFLVALVRAFAGAFSLIVLFLGFLWIIWDKEKQGWHDKIAGTVVVRLPRGVSLV